MSTRVGQTVKVLGAHREGSSILEEFLEEVTFRLGL